MTIGGAVSGALPFMQAQAESLMTDTCTISRPSGAGTLNPATGTYDPPPAIVVYAGQCRVKPRISRGLDQVEAGERPVQIWPYIVSVPMTVTAVKVDDLLTLTASSSDPGLAGRVMVVKNIASGAQISARRLGCIDQETS